MEEFNFDEFVKDLEKTTAPKERAVYQPAVEVAKSDKLNKVMMILPENQGTMYLIPVATETGSPATVISDVREVKLALGDSKWEKWFKLLPKSFYNFVAGSKEEGLYNELISLHEAMRKADFDYKVQKKRNYFLIYGYILKHKNEMNAIVNEKCPGFFIFDNNRMTQAFQAEIKNRSDLAGHLNWMKKWFNRDADKRTGLMTINYTKKGQGTAAIWTSTVSLNTINDDHLGLTDGNYEVEIPQKSIEVFGNQVNAFLGVETDDQRFNYDQMLEVKNKIMSMLGHQSTQVQTPVQPTTTVNVTNEAPTNIVEEKKADPNAAPF